MRAQDANRRRPPAGNETKESTSPRPMSLGCPRPGFVSPPPTPSRSMVPSASVCDLTMSHMWNPGMQQVRTRVRTVYPEITLQCSLSGSVDVSFGHSDSLVPLWSSLGRFSSRIHDELEPPFHVELPHGLPFTANATTSLPRNAVQGAQSSQKCQVQ